MNSKIVPFSLFTLARSMLALALAIMPLPQNALCAGKAERIAKRHAPKVQVPGFPSADVLKWRIDPAAGSSNAPVLFCLVLKIDALGATMSRLVSTGQAEIAFEPSVPASGRSASTSRSFYEPKTFARQTEEIRKLSDLLTEHQGRLAVMAQSPYTRICVEQGVNVLSDVAAAGHEVGLNFDPTPHIGKSPRQVGDGTWQDVMKEELSWLVQACPSSAIRSCSFPGSLNPGFLGPLAGCGLEVLVSPLPKKQSLSLSPWRPDVSSKKKVGAHDPAGKIIILPNRLVASDDSRGNRKVDTATWMDDASQQLDEVLRSARADRVNVFYVVIERAAFAEQAVHEPFALMDLWLEMIVDPLAEDGRLRWSSLGHMAEAYKEWEKANPGKNPLESGS